MYNQGFLGGVWGHWAGSSHGPSSPHQVLHQAFMTSFSASYLLRCPLPISAENCTQCPCSQLLKLCSWSMGDAALASEWAVGGQQYSLPETLGPGNCPTWGHVATGSVSTRFLLTNIIKAACKTQFSNKNAYTNIHNTNINQ